MSQHIGVWCWLGLRAGQAVLSGAAEGKVWRQGKPGLEEKARRGVS